MTTPRASKLDWLKDLRGADLTHAEFRVLVVVSTYTNASRDNAFPSLAQITADSCVAEKTAKRALKSLQRKGWLIRTDLGGNLYGRRRANTYSVRTPETAKGGTEYPPCESRRGVLTSAKGGTEYPRRGVLSTPPSGYRTGPLDHSASDEAGSAPLRRRNFGDFTAVMDWIETTVNGGIDDHEWVTVDGMLANGTDPQAIVNTILARREAS